MLTDAELAEIEARANAATPGPWSVTVGDTRVDGRGTLLELDVGIVSPSATVIEAVGGQGAGGDWGDIIAERADLEFCAHAREDVPRLIAEIRRLRAKEGD